MPASSGEPLPFDAHSVCEKLGARKVLFIGDSAMQQTASTLMNALFPAGCQTQLFYRSGDTLVNIKYAKYNRGDYWVNSTLEVQPDIVILSAGPHVYGRGNYDFILKNVVAETQRLKQTALPNLQVVWKTQQPAGCAKTITTEDIILGKDFQHSEYYERDLYALSVFPRNGIPVLDIRMLYYRPDAHVGGSDCLHLCNPGPLDIVAPLFSQLLDQLTDSDGDDDLSFSDNPFYDDDQFY